MSTLQLTSTQTQVLQHALDHTSGRIDWFPDSVKGGARKKVLDSLLGRELIMNDGTDWLVATPGYEALGMPRRSPITLAALDAVIANAEAAQHGASQVLADEVGADDPSDAEIDASNHIDPVIEAAVAASEALPGSEVKTPRTRVHSKQATIIEMLKRAEGATMAQMCATTGWQAHTIRGSMAGNFKKKLGLTITSTKDAGGQRVYRTQAAALPSSNPDSEPAL